MTYKLAQTDAIKVDLLERSTSDKKYPLGKIVKVIDRDDDGIPSEKEYIYVKAATAITKNAIVLLSYGTDTKDLTECKQLSSAKSEVGGNTFLVSEITVGSGEYFFAVKKGKTVCLAWDQSSAAKNASKSDYVIVNHSMPYKASIDTTKSGVPSSRQSFMTFGKALDNISDNLEGIKVLPVYIFGEPVGML